MSVLFLLYYAAASVVLVLHFTGTLARHRLEWMVAALLITIFPAVLYL